MIPEEIDLLGGVSAAELITNRRGTQTWKVTRDDDSVVALKYATGEARKLTEREANVLKALGSSDVIATGVTEDAAWLVSLWWDAPTLHHVWKDVRTTNNEGNQAAAVAATGRAAAVLAQLHASGWRHCDLQPDHVLIPADSSVRLLDFALAQGTFDIEPRVAYRGGLAHLAAPEVAGELLSTRPDHHVTITTAAEVYMFGAMLFVVWSRQWPHAYDSAQPSVAEIYARVSRGNGRKSTPDGWSHMSALINSAMDREPANRPTMAEVESSLLPMESQR